MSHRYILLGLCLLLLSACAQIPPTASINTLRLEDCKEYDACLYCEIWSNKSIIAESTQIACYDVNAPVRNTKNPYSSSMDNYMPLIKEWEQNTALKVDEYKKTGKVINITSVDKRSSAEKQKNIDPIKPIEAKQVIVITKPAVDATIDEVPGKVE